MRIAILGPAAPQEFSEYFDLAPADLPPGLGGTPVNELVRALLALGHKIHVVTTSPGIEEVKRFDSKNLQISVVPLRRRLRHRALDMYRLEILNMRFELMRIEVDVVHAHWTYEFSLASNSNFPTLLTAHDAPVTILRHMPSIYRLIRLVMAIRVFRSAKNISVVSPHLKSQLRKEMFYRRPLPVISNIVPNLTRCPRKPSGRFVILDVASSDGLKNTKRLIEAFTIVRRTVPSAELRLIGSGLDSAGPIARWAMSKGLQSGILFLGVLGRDEISSNLAEGSVFCHASLEESQGMSILEAMAAEVPVIGGIDSGGVAWTLGNGSAGILVDVRKPDAIAEAILDIYHDKSSCEGHVRNGLKLIQERFSSHAVAEAYLIEYNRIVHESYRSYISGVLH